LSFKASETRNPVHAKSPKSVWNISRFSG
jgi:hypothetical protein